jgi:hypothetical protein
MAGGRFRFGVGQKERWKVLPGCLGEKKGMSVTTFEKTLA